MTKQVTGEIPAGFDRQTQYIFNRSTGDCEWMRLVQNLITRKTHKQELSGTMLADGILAWPHDNFGAGVIGVLHSLHFIRQGLFEKTPEDFSIEIRNCTDNKKEHDPG